MKIYVVRAISVFSEYPYIPEHVEYFINKESAQELADEINNECKIYDEGYPQFEYARGAYVQEIDVNEQ